MNTFEVVLVKSYVVKISAEDREKAKQYVELFIGDSQDISSDSEKKHLKFQIESIDCKVNEVIEVNNIENEYTA